MKISLFVIAFVFILGCKKPAAQKSGDLDTSDPFYSGLTDQQKEQLQETEKARQNKTVGPMSPFDPPVEMMRQVSPEVFKKIKAGLSLDEVMDIMGRPSKLIGTTLIYNSTIDKVEYHIGTADRKVSFAAQVKVK